MAGLLKLGGMAMRSLLSKPATMDYPHKPYPYYPGTRGSIAIDMPRCILCGACARACPANAIAVEKKAHTWSIDRFRCVQCDSCVRVCPTKCLSMQSAYTPCATQTYVDTYTLESEEHIDKMEQPKEKPPQTNE